LAEQVNENGTEIFRPRPAIGLSRNLQAAVAIFKKEWLLLYALARSGSRSVASTGV
jgi:hypothetical protein